jgi:Fe2+ or Zn2+ uptake regulation protein
MMRPGQSRFNKEQRQRVLESHLLHADSQGKEYSKHELLRLVRIAGYDISLATLYNDLEDLARNDSFIQDLASKTYSSIMHLAFNRYNKIYDYSMKIHDSENHLTRKIKSETEKGELNQTISENNASTKLQALAVAKNAVDSIRTMVNGQNLHMSASKWIEATKQQNAVIQDLRNKLKQYEKPDNTSNDSRLDLGI